MTNYSNKNSNCQHNILAKLKCLSLAQLQTLELAGIEGFVDKYEAAFFLDKSAYNNLIEMENLQLLTRKNEKGHAGTILFALAEGVTLELIQQRLKIKQNGFNNLRHKSKKNTKNTNETPEENVSKTNDNVEETIDESQYSNEEYTEENFDNKDNKKIVSYLKEKMIDLSETQKVLSETQKVLSETINFLEANLN